MYKYKNNNLAVKDRVDHLINQMTLEEKVSQMTHDAAAIERLGIPAYNWWNEALHGVGRAGVATVFPQAIGLAATWNPDLMGRIAAAIADEARAKHHEALRRSIREIYTGLTFWSPNINIFRDPRWGRGQETYGEDPYLTASMGVPFVKGLQGDDPHYLKLVATPKHYAVHSGPESRRHSFDAQVHERDLRETYLPHFEACVKEADAYSIMGAYNRTNGEACCASPTLLQKILRDEWGFEGFVVSDCLAIYDIYANHKIVETAAAAAALAVENGCELNCGCTYPALKSAVEQGLIAESAIDVALRRLFTARFLLGMFDPPETVPFSQIPYDVINCEAHQVLALQAARESIVLLKNEDNLLPLSKEIDSIAVIGPNADDLQSLLGNYNGTPAVASSLLTGIRKKVAPTTKVYYAQGCAIADGVPPLEVIPTTYLYPADASEKVNGLTAVYYNNPTFAGTPVIERIDSTVNAIWKDTTPITGRWGDDFSVRWSGFLVPPKSGTYQIAVNGFSAYDLLIDDEMIVTYTDIHHPRIKSREIQLEAGRFYKIRLDYTSKGLDPQVQLLWAYLDTDYLTGALEAAEKADVIIAALGLSPNLEGEEMPVDVEGFFGGDRTDIALPSPQETLLKELHALGKPIILVLLNGSALAVNWADEHVPAILEAWYPGQAGGDALAEVIFGDYNPAGRLPVTFYRSVDDLPPFEAYSMENRTYRYFTGEPLYAFGHGLSYTTFSYDNLSIDQSEVAAGGKVRISVEVTNCGSRAGDEVVQLYTRQTAVPPRPLKELKGYKRISLEPGECKTVTFTLHANQLSVYDEDLLAALHPDRVEVLVGRSSDYLPLKGAFDIVSPTTGIKNDKIFFSDVNVR
ncbi:MAG: glycoside hydrolase family 3 C-terminal domain-containing protein [Anaerolineaceae bacterium]|nr:glycoside hydrolase family 3 C-terminal domain-containing protein [Anaerolineaceae bacterium]